MSNLKNKIVILGDSGVGKTSLIGQYIRGSFTDNQNPTVGAGYFDKVIEVNDQKQKFNFWDTAGEEKFQAMAPIYSQGSTGALIVFDLTRKDTMTHIPNWVNCLQLTGDIPIVVCGNKSDLEDQRQITTDEALQYISNLGYQFFETSANSGSGVEDAFTQIATLSIEYKESQIAAEKREDGPNLVESQNTNDNGGEKHYCC